MSTLAGLRFSKDPLLLVMEGGAPTDPHKVEAAVRRDLGLERRKVLSAVEFMIKEECVAQAVASRAFLADRLRRAEEGSAAAPACRRVGDQGAVLCDACAAVAEVFVKEGTKPALAKARAILASGREEAVEAPAPPGFALDAVRDPAFVRAVMQQATASTLASQRRGVATMAANLEAHLHP